MSKEQENQAPENEAPEEKKRVIDPEKLAAATAKIRGLANDVAEMAAGEEVKEEPEVLYAVVDDEGRPTGFYSSKIHGEPPAGAVQISQEQHQEFIDNPGVRVLVQRGDGFQVEPTEVKNNLTIEIVRMNRDSLLRQSDWTQLPDSPLDDATKAKWATYRQKLRDMMETNADPAKIKFPKAPE